ncbi:RNA polymerase sigma factor [Cognatitamlana onchidii]|uniref:RNA polymerase sigma factor n=1 Tax=Cognatitamlana onchidii TaxID=2562860 RepID=UPI0010A632AA|nr:RNA polymerase sigma factor [Algibacter onchidii]
MNKKQQIRDGNLVLAYQSGNKTALQQLVKYWHKSFCEKAYWLVKDADVAKDIAQDSWSVIISKIDNLKKPESFASWALRIVYHRSIDWIKKNNKSRLSLIDYAYNQEQIEVEEQTNSQLKQQLLSTINKLPRNQQVVIRMFYVQDYSLKEISSILNITVGTAKSRLFHAREKMKLILNNRNYEK